MEENDTIISVENVVKIYKLYNQTSDRLKEAILPRKKKWHKEFRALDGVSFKVSKGEIVGVIGKNGSGKSTLLKLITGVLQPTSGSVVVNGKVSALLELGAGFNPEYTGMENIFLNGTIMGYSKEEMDRKISKILAFADIGDFVYQPVKTYSSGMFARLAFAVAINVEPEILIIDEALSVGDAAFQAKCMKKMRDLMEQGCTILFVSHDTGAIKSLCNRVIYIENGKIKLEGDAGTVSDIYINDLRSNEGLLNRVNNIHPIESASKSSKAAKKFAEAVSNTRSGTGEAIVQYCALYNAKGEPCNEFDFNQKMTLRIEVISKIDLDEIVVGMHVRDKNQVELVGTNTRYEGINIKNVRANKLNIIEFSFANYLRSGYYTFTILLVDNIPTNKFFDRIDNVALFKSNDPPNQTRWSLMGIPMDVTLL
ncbi:teichoic acid transport system ATP-binding protein [Fontibacillus panacisegetis]|uniref:Teichoic acid transport system ATP-binding protein n=1 Tax=Fontibacillus panacisegetis TaxID=670482 RepID=A0A1G7SZY2_9BACL|nr:ABC transporter ATP-binding protein [Fontibacillus panacisegetis]SDG28518.1 teichoic acid transport system ATP-binding protein [Fontibacillus panacisegetis]